MRAVGRRGDVFQKSVRNRIVGVTECLVVVLQGEGQSYRVSREGGGVGHIEVISSLSVYDVQGHHPSPEGVSKFGAKGRGGSRESYPGKKHAEKISLNHDKK